MNRAELETALLDSAKDSHLVREHFGYLNPWFQIIALQRWEFATARAMSPSIIANALSKATQRVVKKVIPCSAGYRTPPLPWMTEAAFAETLTKSLNSGPSSPLGLWSSSVGDDPELLFDRLPSLSKALDTALLTPLSAILEEKIQAPLRVPLVHYILQGVSTAQKLFWRHLLVGERENALRYEPLLSVLLSTPIIGPALCANGECDVWIVACA